MATQNMRRLKFAKFYITKKYTNQSLEDLVLEKRAVKGREKMQEQKLAKKEYLRQM